MKKGLRKKDVRLPSASILAWASLMAESGSQSSLRRRYEFLPAFADVFMMRRMIWFDDRRDRAILAVPPDPGKPGRFRRIRSREGYSAFPPMADAMGGSLMQGSFTAKPWGLL